MNLVDRTIKARKAPAVGGWPRRLIKSIGVFLIAACLTASRSAATSRHSGLTRFTYIEYHMGVDARLVVYAADKTIAENACAAAFERIAALDSMMSDYLPASELMQLCAKSGGPPVRVSHDLFVVLRRAQEVSRLSSGAFDATVGPVVALWRRARKTGVLPDPKELDEARKKVGWQKVILNERDQTVKLSVPGMKLDLGGIAKGYADDEAQRVLKKHGITRALVEMGGDIVVSGPPPGKSGWTIQVPNAGSKEMSFVNCAISSSGDTEQFVVIGGKRYSHIVDPRTGQAMTSRVQTTVIARDGLTSDPLTKATIMLDKLARLKLLKSYPGAKTYVRSLPP